MLGRLSLPVVSLIMLSGCMAEPSPTLSTAADSLAFRVTEAAGGLPTWNALPGIEWEWIVTRDSAELIRTRIVWDKVGNRARVEWPAGDGSVYVAVYDPTTFDEASPAGDVALNGVALTDSAAARLLDANRRFINDG
ncbi:MAG: hypothetical protein AAGK21_12465, partial [Bacteroidota bacterium]